MEMKDQPPKPTPPENIVWSDADGWAWVYLPWALAGVLLFGTFVWLATL